MRKVDLFNVLKLCSVYFGFNSVLLYWSIPVECLLKPRDMVSSELLIFVNPMMSSWTMFHYKVWDLEKPINQKHAISSLTHDFFNSSPGDNMTSVPGMITLSTVRWSNKFRSCPLRGNSSIRSFCNNCL